MANVLKLVATICACSVPLGCSDGPCVENAILVSAQLLYDDTQLSFESRDRESQDKEAFELARAVADDISSAPSGSFLWGFTSTNELLYRLGFNTQIPQPQNSQLQWDPNQSPWEQGFAVINGREEDDKGESLRIVTEGSIEIVSSAPTVIRLDLLFTPLAVGSTLTEKRMTGDAMFEEVGNTFICETP